MKKVFITKTAGETQKMGQKLAKDILRASFLKKLSDTLVLELIGDLGGGKTTFLQGFAKGIGIKTRIASPTFIIIKSLKIPVSDKFFKQHSRNLYHIDAYRLKNSKDAVLLGVKDILSVQGNIIAIEWADKIKDILPKKAIKIRFFLVDKNKRKIVLNIPYAIYGMLYPISDMSYAIPK